MVQADLVQVAYCEVAQLSMLRPTSLAVYCPPNYPNCHTSATIMKKEWNINQQLNIPGQNQWTPSITAVASRHPLQPPSNTQLQCTVPLMQPNTPAAGSALEDLCSLPTSCTAVVGLKMFKVYRATGIQQQKINKNTY